MNHYLLLVNAMLLSIPVFAQAPANVKAVDLGLPSGLLWANMNIGAERASDYGDYFAWGETATKHTFGWSSYKFGVEDSYTKYGVNQAYTKVVDGLMVLQPEDDAASVLWGDGWRMPTKEEFEELMQYCESSWGDLNGTKGYMFDGLTDEAIFLPAGGYVKTSSPEDVNAIATYWTSSLEPEYNEGYKFDNKEIYGSNRSRGRSIRPVKSVNTAIDVVNVNEKSTIAYDILGRVVDPSSLCGKGLIIVNGKKVVLK